MKDELSGKIMKDFAPLRPNMCSYVTNVGCVDKKAKDIKRCASKQEIRFQKQDCKILRRARKMINKIGKVLG